MLNFSQGMLNAAAGLMSWQSAIGNARFMVYDGTIPVASLAGGPASDAAVSGTLLAVFTQNSAVYTGEARAMGSIQVTAGSVDTDTIQALVGGFPISGVVSWTTSNAVTASLLASSINLYRPGFLAVIDSTNDYQVDIYAPIGYGADFNSVAITTALGGDATTTNANFGGGVTCLNGLSFSGPPVAGLLTGPSDQIWSGVALANGTARYGRWIADPTDDGSDTSVSGILYRRIQGTIATSGGDFNISSTAFTLGATETITTKTFQV